MPVMENAIPSLADEVGSLMPWNDSLTVCTRICQVAQPGAKELYV